MTLVQSVYLIAAILKESASGADFYISHFLRAYRNVLNIYVFLYTYVHISLYVSQNYVFYHFSL